MPRGYWLPQIDVSDAEGYKAYMAATPPAHEKYHGTALVRGGRSEVVEGSARGRCVVREFPDYESALACYRSDEYQRARPLRLEHAQCDFVIAEGYDGPQPAVSPLAPKPAAKKGYWLYQVDIGDAEGYGAYVAASQPLMGKYGARYLVRGGNREVTEGRGRARIIVVEFPSYEMALAAYRSGEYRAVKTMRDGKGTVDLVIVEGYDGPKF